MVHSPVNNWKQLNKLSANGSKTSIRVCWTHPDTSPVTTTADGAYWWFPSSERHGCRGVSNPRKDWGSTVDVAGEYDKREYGREAGETKDVGDRGLSKQDYFMPAYSLHI